MDADQKIVNGSDMDSQENEQNGLTVENVLYCFKGFFNFVLAYCILETIFFM